MLVLGYPFSLAGSPLSSSAACRSPLLAGGFSCRPLGCGRLWRPVLPSYTCAPVAPLAWPARGARWLAPVRGGLPGLCGLSLPASPFRLLRFRVFVLFAGFGFVMTNSVSCLPSSLAPVVSSVASSPLAGFVPASFAVAPGSAPVPASAFVPVCSGGAVVLSGVALFRSSGGAPSLRVSWSCPVSGLSGSLVARAAGFPGGVGGAASGDFLAAVRRACFSGVPVFVAGASGVRSGSVASGFFCALSSAPFASPAASVASAPVVF